MEENINKAEIVEQKKQEVKEDAKDLLAVLKNFSKIIRL